ncbi:MAG: ABC transporter ATP-binding protein [Selenomonadaceae bacterium]|nr:ABC transporter ATP-binding protein [Selenomonadaceae bacterium]
MIEVKNLSVRYGEEKFVALTGVNLTVPTGTVCVLIGPSGCGKSSLLRAVAGLQSAAGGEVLVDGLPLKPTEKKIGFMPQNYGLLPWRTVRDNALLGCRIKGTIDSGTEARLARLLAVLGLKGMEDRYPGELSGGQQQRVSLARIFLMEPDILLMDEPFSALDTITREDMQEVFLSLWRKQAVTTLLVTHYVEEALYLGNKIVLMASHPGRVTDVMENPLFGATDLRSDPAYFALAGELRRKIKETRGA